MLRYLTGEAALKRKKDLTEEERILYNRNWYKGNKENHQAVQRRHSRTRAGIKDATGEKRIGTCPICSRGPAVLLCDHDHETGIIRGWICRRCNVALGLFRDAVDILERALSYLKGRGEHNAKEA